MTQDEIEHMWKIASNDPNHDTNWNDAVVIAFAKLVAHHERDAMQHRVDTLHKMYEMVCRQRDELMDDQRAQIESLIQTRGKE